MSDINHFSVYSNCLTVVCLTEKTKSFICELPICIINENEELLDRGRFVNFSLKPLFVSYDITFKNDYSEKTFIEWTTKLIEWISDNVVNKWGLNVDYKDINDIDFIWCFENKDDAILFRLSN